MVGDIAPFQATDALELVALNYPLTISGDGIYLLLGPSAPSGKPAEIYDALVVRLREGIAQTRPVSKAVTIDETGATRIHEHGDLGRIILTQHTLVDMNQRDEVPIRAPFILRIEGGNGTTSIEAALKTACEAQGITNAAFFLIANGGEKMKIASAILNGEVTGEIESLSALKALQLPKDSYGGSIQVHGHFTTHHPDSIFNARTGLTYNLHRHGIGKDGEGRASGAHVNGVFPDSETVAYIVVKPITSVFEVDGPVESIQPPDLVGAYE